MKRFLVLITLFVFVSAHSAPEDYLDSKLFSPSKSGISSFNFDFKIEGIEKFIKERTSIQPSGEVYFNATYVFPGKFDIIVKGIDPKMVEFISQLKELAISRLPSVFSQNLSMAVRSYVLNEKKMGKNIVIEAVDATMKKEVSKIEFVFDEDGKILTTTINFPSSLKKNFFSVSKKGWSNGKFVVDKIVTLSKTLNAEHFETIKYEYQTIGGIGLPSEVVIQLNQATPESKIGKLIAEEKIKIWNYRLNSRIK